MREVDRCLLTALFLVFWGLGVALVLIEQALAWEAS
jgi:hypothetical protein